MGREQRRKQGHTRSKGGRALPLGEGSASSSARSLQARVLQAGIRAGRSKALILGLAALMVLAGGALGLKLIASPRGAGRGQSIILVSIDTLRADRLPVYGYAKIQTPAIDDLARHGTVFDDCYSQVPLTLPSHTSIFTGLLPSVHGVRDNVGFRLSSGARTLAAELKQAGYATGGAVSAYVLHSSTGIAQGFDWYDDEFKAPSPGTDLTDIRRDGMETVDRALSWVDDRSKAAGRQPGKSTPLFLFVHLYEPHAPYTAPERFRRHDRAPYDAAVMYSDEIVGHLFEGLRRLDLYDPSLVILLSDHGEGLRDHGEETHGVFLYREVMHVPLIIKLPAGKNGGRRIQVPVQLIDIAPTILDWAGIKRDPQIQGTSLIPALQSREFSGDRFIYAESLYGRLHFGWKELFSLTNSRYNFILAPREELYDLRQDPGEAHNLLVPGPRPGAQLPPPVAREYERMRQELTGYVEKIGSVVPNPVAEEQLKKLQALGYIGSSAPDTASGSEAPDPKDRIGDLVLYQQAMRMKTVFMFPKVAEILQDVLKTSPRMIDAWDQLSEVYQRLGRLDKAADALRHSLDVAPQRTQQRFQLVDILIQLKRFDEAREELGIAMPHDFDEAMTRRAFLEVAEAKPAAARQTAAQAAKGLPGAVPFIEGMLAYDMHEYSQAQPLFREALAELQGHSPDALPYIHFFLGDSLAREGREVQDATKRVGILQEAEQELQTELALRPTNAAAATSLCFVAAMRHDLAKVDQVLNEFARQNPSAATYGLIAHLYDNLRLNDRAARWRERARLAGSDAGATP